MPKSDRQAFRGVTVSPGVDQSPPGRDQRSSIEKSLARDFVKCQIAVGSVIDNA